MTVSGFPASHEQIGPAALLRDVRHAEAAGFDANVRGETLSIPEFARIANELVRRRG